MAMTDQVTFRTYQRSDRAWVIRENLRFYSSVYGFDASFVDAQMAALDHLETQLGHQTSTYLIAENPTEPIGCIFLSADNHGTARTSVIVHNVFGRIYMIPVGVAHRLIVRRMLNRLQNNISV